MKFNEYCPLKKDVISEGQCVEILAELGGFKKAEQIVPIKKKHMMTKNEMDKVCESCPNYPY